MKFKVSPYLLGFVILLFAILYKPESTYGQRVVFNVFGIRGSSTAIAGYENWMEAESCTIPFKTIHQADRNGRLDAKDYDRTANLIYINRQFEPSINNFLSGAKSGQSYRELQVEYIILVRNEWKTVSRYTLKDVVVQSVALNYSANSSSPTETLVFAYSALSIEQYIIDPRTGAVISSKKSKVIAEADARNN